jgi:hypothetical protein
MTVEELIKKHAVELEAQFGFCVSVEKEGQRFCVVLSQVTLPAGLFAVAKTDMLFLVDNRYPNSALDMFWTEMSVLTQDGKVPQKAEVIQSFLGKQWRRFSWHKNAPHNPSGNPLIDHFVFVESRWDREAA